MPLTSLYSSSLNIFTLARFIFSTAFITSSFFTFTFLTSSSRSTLSTIISTTSVFLASSIMNVEWDYNYYQPWSDNEWLVDEMLAMLDEDIIMQ